MKTIIFILLLLITAKVFSQISFPDSNAIWNVNYINSVGTPTDEMLYGLKGDTLINDTIYNKLYTLSDTTLSVENLQDYIGCFRLEGQKVWFKPAYWSYQDILLYDFSASVGDTVWHNGGAYYGQPTFEIGYIYSIIQEIEGNGLRTYKVQRGGENGGLTCEWYEGIGSNFGLFGSIIQFPLVGDTYNLACFKHNDTVKYQSNLMCNKCFCSGLTGIEEEKNNTVWINIFPNPAQNSLTIDVQKPYSKIIVEIIDEKGGVIYKKESLDSPIALNDLIHGIYFVKLLVDNETITRKIIIE
jgi:hypothetical protein